MADVPEEQDCAWRDEALRLPERVGVLEETAATVIDLQAQLEQLQRAVFGRKSEKLPTPDQQLRQQGRKADPAKTQATRAERRRQKAELESERIEHAVPPEQCVCPKCGADDLKPLGPGEERVIYERVPERFVRHVHVLQKLACRCGEHVVTAPGPRRVAEQTSYGPGLIAHLVVSKCADSTPFYRLEKACKRSGMPLSRSTMVDLFHRAADEVEPLYVALMDHIAQLRIVQADETPLKTQKKRGGKSYIWTFVTPEAVGYRFSAGRSGETPIEVLGGSPGTLVVDAYSGYNAVCTPEERERAGCLAHARRKLFEARDMAPEDVDIALGLILDVYRVERDAKEADIVGSKEHLALRQSKGKAAMGALHAWLLEQEPRWPPKSKLGKAIRYGLNQWTALTVALGDSKVPVDNNASERALRVIALGRKNYLFVGHPKAGQNTAMLYSLVASCEANGVNPEAYLADVLLRVQTHPAERIEELLPHRWRPVTERTAAPEALRPNSDGYGLGLNELSSSRKHVVELFVQAALIRASVAMRAKVAASRTLPRAAWINPGQWLTIWREVLPGLLDAVASRRRWLRGVTWRLLGRLATDPNRSCPPTRTRCVGQLTVIQGASA